MENNHNFDIKNSKIAFLTLGCKVNSYETEAMQALFVEAGATLVEFSELADIYVVNTCSVTNMADRKSRQMLHRAKKKNPNAIVVAAGCYAQTADETAMKETGIDVVIGNNQKKKIVEIISSHMAGIENRRLEIGKETEYEDLSLATQVEHTRAYIKIQDGCDNYCTFCIIPYVRGHVRCKKKEDVMKEALNLVSKGHKEIVLTGIHTGNYHDNNYDLADLLNDLVKIDGLLRLRISSIEITELNNKILDVLKNSKILVNHLHIPLQSGSDTILKSMNRKYDVNYFKEKISLIRKIRPNINITTDVIVGFPGETEELFLETISTIKDINFTKLHVFPYSKREGTKAATMSNQVNGKIKKERVKTLMELSKTLEQNYMRKYLNKNLKFIPEVYKDGYVIGHTGNYLLIKTKGNENMLNIDQTVKIKEINYPYAIAE